jgi:hypothetical protein
MIVDPHHDDLLPQPGILAERPRNHHSALLVQLRLGRSGEEVAVHQAAFPTERVELPEARLDGVGPVAARVRGETPLDSPREDQAFVERLSELGREREAVLFIDRMLVLT